MARPPLIRPGPFDNIKPAPAKRGGISAQPPSTTVPADVGQTWGQFTSTVGLTVPFYVTIAKAATAAIRRAAG